LLHQLRHKALDSGKPFKQVVNETLRAGLSQPLNPARDPYSCPTFSIGALAPGVDLSKATLIAAKLDDDALIDKLRQGR
jgi:hypothetical protein